MRTGFQVIVKAAFQEIEYVIDCRDELKGEHETRKLWKAWSGLLDHYAKAVSAMRRATDCGPSKKWSDSLLAEQKADLILQYAFQARDSAAHVFENPREVEPRSVTMGNLIKISGNSSVTLKDNYTVDASGRRTKLPEGDMIIQDGRFQSGTVPLSALSQNEHHLVLSTVVTRSGSYPVPNTSSPTGSQAVEIANYVANWLSKKRTELQALVDTENSGRAGF